MVPRQVALLILVLASVATGSSAQTAQFEVVDLPPGSLPLAIAADEDGALWLTLVGAWAFARYDPAEDRLDTFELPIGPTKEREELFDILLDSEGRAWTASNTHAFRLDPATGNVTAFELAAETDLSGGLAETEDGIAIALVTADRVALLDPDDGAAAFVEVDTLETPDGPLKLARGGDGALLGSATYANGIFEIAGDAAEMHLAGKLRGPVGLAIDGDEIWTAEMGGSSVAMGRLHGVDVFRYPTTPSHYYDLSGPAGIAVAPNGDVWFVEHFADRIGILDVERGLLEEVQVPGAPGTNVQFLALSEGRFWFPLMTKDKLVSMAVREPREPPFTLDAVAFGVDEADRSFELTIDPTGDLSGGDLVAAPNREEFSFEPGASGQLAVTVKEGTPVGVYRFLVSYDTTDAALGRYVEVQVNGRTVSDPFPGVLAALAVLVVATLLMRRRA